MDTSPQITLKFFLQTVKKVAINANNLEQHKRRLSQAVSKIEDYAECFRLVDLDKKGIIYPKVMQNFLMYRLTIHRKHKYYFDPTAINRFYSKYSHQKRYLEYQDLLEALLPHQDYILIANTISSTSQPSKFVYSCHKQRIKTIEYFTAFVLQLEIKYLSEDFKMMKNVTKNSQRIGAILWRLLDRNHDNSLNYSKVQESATELKINLSEGQWMTFLYWQFYSYKKNINRNDFMRILDIQEERKRATSACEIDQFKLEKQIYQRAQEDRLRTIRIEQAIKQKLQFIPFLDSSHYREIVKEEHFPFEYLEKKKHLKGKAGYSKPKTMVKYAVERYV